MNLSVIRASKSSTASSVNLILGSTAESTSLTLIPEVPCDFVVRLAWAFLVFDAAFLTAFFGLDFFAGALRMGFLETLGAGLFDFAGDFDFLTAGIETCIILLLN